MTSAFRFVPGTLVALALMLAAPNVARADTTYTVLMGGRPVDKDGTSGRERNGRVFVDVVKVTRALAGIMTFHDADHTVLVTLGGHSLQILVGSKEAEIDGADATLPAAPFTDNGDIYVPLETIAKVAGATYTTDTHGKTVELTPATPAPAPAAT